MKEEVLEACNITLYVNSQVMPIIWDCDQQLVLNLVAEVGGYVGLFLGYSVLQVTDLMDILIHRKFMEILSKLF